MVNKQRYDFYWSEIRVNSEFARGEGRIMRFALLDDGREVQYYECCPEGTPSAVAKYNPDTVFLGSGVISKIIDHRTRI